MSRPKPSPPKARKTAPAAPAPSSSAAVAFRAAFAADPVATVLDLLADEAEALGAVAIKRRLVDRGVPAEDANAAWSGVQEKIRYHDHVVFENRMYRFTKQPRTITPGEAVYQLSKGGEPGQRAQWLAVIESALSAGLADPAQLADARTRIADAQVRIDALEQELAKLAAAPAPTPAAEPEPSAHDQYDRAERRRAARERQARIDAMSTVAELAAEVEELTAKRATAEVLLEHTRALTGDRGLEAIGRAGESSPYDENRHDPVGDVPAEGEPVTVIRPGYLWHAPGEAVLISRAIVKRT